MLPFNKLFSNLIYFASCLAVFLYFLLFYGEAEDKSIKLLTTTSTENSGLLGYLLPKFTELHGIKVHVIAMGTGMALRAAEQGDGDLLMVHDVASELAFIDAGFGHSRRPFMYNDFIIVGADQDPAEIRGSESINAALLSLYKSQATFISRADDSGTHKREMWLWSQVGLYPKEGSMIYREVGSGMGEALNITAVLDGYTLSDRGTWTSFNNRQNLQELVSGDASLLNQYSLIEINNERHPKVKGAWARALSDWLISQQGQDAIDSFRVREEALFNANYGSLH